MKELPFGAAVYKQYKTTFLASVIVGLKYSKVQDAESHKEQWDVYTRTMFNIPPLGGIFQKQLMINSNDERLSYVFNDFQTMVRIAGNGYQNFADTVIPQSYKLKQFVSDVVGSNKATSLGIRKVDVFQIEADINKIGGEDSVRRYFFSPEFINLDKPKAELNEEERKMSNMIKYQWTEDDNTLTVRSVFLKDKNAENKYRLILDIDGQYTPIQGFELDQMEKILKEVNMDLYNAFMWCVNDNVKIIMER